MCLSCRVPPDQKGGPKCKTLAQGFLGSMVEGTKSLCTIALGVITQLSGENELGTAQRSQQVRK